MSTSPEPESVQELPLDRLRPHPQAGRVPGMGRLDFVALRASIDALGVTHPLHVTKAGVVLDGHERLRAATELGLARVPVQIVEAENEIAYMLRAALQRRQLTPSQRAVLALELSDYESLREQGQERQRANLPQNVEVATSPPRGKTRDHIAAIAGVSARTAQDVITVYEADPALLQQIKEGKPADVLARRVRRARRDAALPPAPPLPDGPFEVIYADPPWQFGNADGAYAPENHYPTMPLEEIIALSPPVAENAVLFLWAVNCLLPEALEVMEAWGFAYDTNFAWVKPSIGLGNLLRNRHELLLVGKRGKVRSPDPEDRPDSVIEAPRGRHSEKPDAAYERIERMFPGLSKLELFARGTPRRGWVAWGNEAETP